MGTTGPQAMSHACGHGVPAQAQDKGTKGRPGGARQTDGQRGGVGSVRAGGVSVCACLCPDAQAPRPPARGPTHRPGCGGRQERRRGQPRGEGGECVLVLVCVLVCVLVLVELRPQQSPRAQGGAGPLGALDQKTRVQLLPEQLVIYKRKRERQRGTSAAGSRRGEADSHLALPASAGQAVVATGYVRAPGWR